MEQIISLLEKENCSCVIKNQEIRTFHRQGVIDLYELLKQEPDFLKNASIADKIVGKAAATLMVLGGVKELYTYTISDLAFNVLKDANVAISYGQKVPVILNRTQQDLCPLEKLCSGQDSKERTLQVIEHFINGLNINKK